MSRKAFVTLATNDDYAMGALALAESLHQSATTKQLVVLITNQVSSLLRQRLSEVFHHVYVTSELCSQDDLALSLLGRPELGVTFTKLHCWRLTQFQKCVFLDADTLVLQNCDELFDREELSAVPDTGWPDCFNSGVFVFRPSLDTYAKLVGLAVSKGSFDGGDQGLLNTYFGSWRSDLSRRLPFVYNVVSSLSYTYAPAYKHYSSGVKIVHFAGSQKPWAVRWTTDTGDIEGGGSVHDLQLPIVKMWIDIFRDKVLPKLPEAAQSLVYQSTTMTVIQILNRINASHTKQCGSHTVTERGDHPEFPTNAMIQKTWIPPSLPPPPPPPPPSSSAHFSHHDLPPPASAHTSYRNPPPPSSSYVRYHEPPLSSLAHVGHQDPSLPQSLPPPPSSAQISHYDPSLPSIAFAAPPLHTSSPPSVHQELSAPPESLHQCEFSYPDSNPEARYTPSMDSLGDGRLIIKEPIDPHWEALFWHTVQTPWEPPELPPSSEYHVPPSQIREEELNAKPTFGWFSEHSGATPQHEEWTETWHAPSFQEPPLLPSTHQEVPPDEAASTQISSADHNCDETARDLEAAVEQETAESLVAETEESSTRRMKSWEEGNIDYLGKDRFENIWKKIEMMFTDPEPESQFEEDLEECVARSTKHNGSMSASSIVDDEQSPVPEDDGVVEEPEEVWPGYPEGDFTGMLDWQEGRIDYCGRDRSDNIMRRLDLIISGGLLQND